MFEKYFQKLEKRVHTISSRNYSPAIFSLERLLVIFSHAYGFGVKLRLWLYEKGALKQKTLPCFVISIGNIVVGGAGKTPMAIYVAELLRDMGKKVVVISRGYKGKYKNDSVIVSDGDQIFVDAKTSGDEPYMMAKRRSFPVVVGRDRFKAGLKAIDAFNPEVIVLDDGFQHLKLKRDLDLLLLDYESPFGNRRFLPAGRLRETPEISLKRAGALIFTRSSTKDDTLNVKDVRKHCPDVPCFKTFHRPFLLKQIVHNKNKKEDINDCSGLKGKKALLFSGLAKNTVFFHAMEDLGINILDHLEFKDHYRYKEPDILMINKAASKVCADLILTTEKDWAKLSQDTKWVMDFMVIGIQIEFEHSHKFKFLLNSRLKKQ